MAAPGHTTALRSETFQKLQLNAGIFLKDFDYSSITDATALKTAIVTAVQSGTGLIGATRGGGTFTATREIRTPEIDGMRYGFKGSDFVDSADAYLSTTAVEITPENFAILLGGEATVSGLKTTVKMKTELGDDAYLNNLCWVGDLADGRYVLIKLDNAINTSDFTFTFTDKGEGTIAVEFHARQEHVDDYDYAPFEVVFFETTGTMGEITVTSAAGTSVGSTALTTTNTLASGESYVYKIGTSSTAPTAVYHETPDYTWTTWDGSSDLLVGTSANGKKATVAVINSNAKFVKSGTVTLAVKTA